MPSSTVENYVKQLYLLGQNHPDRLVPMGDLARAMHVVPGTATTMVKALAKARLLQHTPRVGARLTPTGEQLALQMLRKHRLIEMFLVHTLGLDWAEIHEEAELLEHAWSDRLVERLDAFLGHPRVDPHGDPIPSAAGRMPAPHSLPLAELPPGVPACITRITRQDAKFLRFINDAGLRPGCHLRLTRRDPVADLLAVTLADQREISLGGQAASHILVERLPGASSTRHR
jgi:DtxR family Mn-dependent transcriptional regulator